MRASTLPERHLGLVQAGETADIDRRLDALADAIEASVDLDAVRAARRPGELADGAVRRGFEPPGQRIALARDRAFSFMYPHLLDRWRSAGAEILAFLAARRRGARSAAPMRCGCPAAIPSFMPARWRRRIVFTRRLRVLAGRARSRSMASAVATWCWGRGSRMPTDGAMPWRASCSSRPRSPSAGCISATAAHGCWPTCPLGSAGDGDHGSRVPLCQRALERRRAVGRLPRCDGRVGAGRRRAARLGERHVLSCHRQATDMTPTFDAAFRAQFRDLVLWRRDVRRFRADPDRARAHRCAARDRQPCAVGRLEPALALRARRTRPNGGWRS